MNKAEAATYLGRSVRQLERLTGAKRITAYKVRNATGQIADFREADLERLKAELDEEEGRVVVAETISQPTPRHSSPPLSTSGLATTRRREIEPLPQETRALARVDHAPRVVELATIDQSAPPAFVGVFAASLRVLLTVADVCELSQLGERRVRDALRSGELKGKQIGRRWRVHRDDFAEWARALI